MSEHDPLDALRALWSRAQPPPLDPSERARARDADQPLPADPAARAALLWLRAAWAAQVAPPLEPPVACAPDARGQRAQRGAGGARRAGWAALAGAALAASLALWLGLRAAPRPLAERGPGAPSVARAAPSRAIRTRPVHASLRADGTLEARAGRVRLVLCTPGSSRSHPPAGPSTGDIR